MLFNERHKNAVIAVLTVSVFLALLLDQLIKWMVINKGGFFILNNFLDINFYKNYGTAFGIPVPYYILYPLILLAIILIIWRYGKDFIRKNLLVVAPCLIIFAGAISNIFDRIYRGYVVDYIHFSFGSTFNIADIMIVAGVAILLWKEIRYKNKEKGKIA